MFNWKLNRIRYKLPNRPFAKTAKDNRMARLVDLDATVEETNTILESIDSEVSALSDAQPLYAEYTVSLADMNAGDAKVAFPALSPGSSYAWDKMILEASQSDVTVPSNGMIAIESNMGGAIIDGTFVNNEVGESDVNVRQVVPSVGVAQQLLDASYLSKYNAEALYQNGADRVTIAFIDDSLSTAAFTGGTSGSILIKFWYHIETNGSNL